MIAHEILSDSDGEGDFLREHVRFIRQVYRERRDAMLDAMERYFPPEVRWTRPQGGLFLWVTLPDNLDTTELLKDAIALNVAFVPGRAFSPGPGGHNTLRLNFSFCDPERIELGIRRLGEVFFRAVESGAVTLPEPEAEPQPA
jgi:2-aminoadipate transaminase